MYRKKLEGRVDDKDIEGFEKWLTEKGYSPFTSVGYKNDVRGFARWFKRDKGFHMSPDTILAKDVEGYREHLLVRKGASPRTFNRRLAAIRSYLNWAREEGHLIGDPLKNIQMLPENRDPPMSLKVDEIKALMKVSKRLVRTAKNPLARLIARRDHAMLAVLIETGMRLSELSLLDLPDVDLTRKKGFVNCANGTNSKQRSITLEASTRKALRSWLQVRPKTRSDAVFTNTRTGNRLGWAAVQSRIRRIGGKTRVNVTIHAFRHSVAKRMIDEGNTIDDVAGRLGIRDVYYVARTYRPLLQKG